MWSDASVTWFFSISDLLALLLASFWTWLLSWLLEVSQKHLGGVFYCQEMEKGGVSCSSPKSLDKLSSSCLHANFMPFWSEWTSQHFSFFILTSDLLKNRNLPDKIEGDLYLTSSYFPRSLLKGSLYSDIGIPGLHLCLFTFTHYLYRNILYSFCIFCQKCTKIMYI